MSVSKTKPAIGLPVAADRLANIRVDCYVRSTVPAAVTGTITDIVDRLRQLCENGVVTDVQVLNWPPECRSFDDPVDEHRPTRDELVTEFERWADRHDHSLEPAFHRREVAVSSFEVGVNDSIERVRVPLVALAFYEAEDSSAAEPGSLRGVVPYSERFQTGNKRTHTVHEWLSAVETRADGGRERTTRHGRPTGREEVK